jgi:ABC-type sugar transport system ATPase subunit
MAQVVLRGLNKKYDEVHAVKDVNLTIRDKEFMVLVGPSGCGKTTTLRMVAGLEEITSGEIAIGERIVNDLPPKDRDIAMVFQNYALYPHMSVYDNMAFGLKMRKFPRPEIHKRVQDAAEILGIQELLKRKPRQLSGGQRQRVAVGRAIVRHPQVFLFDEPLSNLDAKLRVQMRFEIQKLHRRLSTTSLYVTHDQVEAMTLANRMIVMNAGRAEQVGTPMQVYENPQTQFVAGFIGSPAMNFLPGRIEAGNRVAFEHGGGSRLDGAPRTPGDGVVVGIRPEHLDPAHPDEATVSGKVEMVEMLGADMLIHFAHGPSTVHARLPHGPQPDIGATVHFRALPDRVFLFEPASGERLR